MKYIGKIINKSGKVIFCRTGTFVNEAACLNKLKELITVDNPSPESFIYNKLFGGGFNDSIYCLSNHYGHVSELTFKVEQR